MRLQKYHGATDHAVMTGISAHAGRRNGFSLLEVIIAMLVIGVLSAIAIPRFLVYQHKAKSAEAKTNLSAIRIAEESYFSEFEQYVSAIAEPAVVPGGRSTIFDATGGGFATLGFDTEGDVYFSYGVAVSADRIGYSADAGADIDEDGIVQLWGYAKPDASGTTIAGQVGCSAAALTPLQIAPCDPAAGKSIF